MPDTWRHKKRGTTYHILMDDVEFQVSTDIKDGETITIYQSTKDGKIWARPSKEFMDGRFEKINNPVDLN